VGIRCADHVTPLYPQKLALTFPTGGGRSVGIVRSRTKAMEFLVSYNAPVASAARVPVTSEVTTPTKLLLSIEMPRQNTIVLVHKTNTRV
jgi:hypothetical protein